MSINSTNVIIEESTNLIDELQDLLEQQIELAHKGDPGGKRFEELSLRTDFLVEKIARAGIPESEQFKDRREQIKKLYDSLYPTVATQKVATAKHLGRVQKGRKTIATYRNNI